MHKLIFTTATLFTVLSAGASAATLTGETVNLRQLYIDGATEIEFSNNTTTVSGAVEFDSSILGAWSFIDITDSQVFVVRNGSFSAADFNGEALYFPNLILNDVSIAQLAGNRYSDVFTADRVTFDAHNIYINWQGGAWNTYETGSDTPIPLILNITATNAETPEPASAGLVLLAGAALFGLKSRRLTGSPRGEL